MVTTQKASDRFLGQLTTHVQALVELNRRNTERVVGRLGQVEELLMPGTKQSAQCNALQCPLKSKLKWRERQGKATVVTRDGWTGFRQRQVALTDF